MKPLIFSFAEDRASAQRLAKHLDGELAELTWHRFPDRESLVTLPIDCNRRDVVLVCALTQPDTKTLPLYFAAYTARELGARSVGVVAPYLGYMRQDHRFVAGQSVSALAYGRLLSSCCDWLVTVDPHLHRIKSLAEVFSIPAVAVSAMPAVSEWIKAHIRRPVIVGPDLESRQWVECVADSLDAPWIVLEKTRRGDRDVSVTTVDPALVRNRAPVLLDDICSSGHTLAEALKGVATHTNGGVACTVVHALFADEAEALVRSAGARTIVSTNTVPHATNAMDVSPLIATAVRSFL